MNSPNANQPSGSEPPALADIRRLILDACAPALTASGMTAENAPGDLDLRASGMIDSLGFIELVVEIEDNLGIEIDFDGLDPEQITTLDPLARHVHEQMLAQAGKTQ